MSLWSLSLQHILCHYASIITAYITSIWSLSWHNIYYVTMQSIVTAAMTSLWSYYYSIYNVPMISIATASIMTLCLYCYSIYYVFMISLVTTSTTSQWSPLLQHLIRRNILLNTIGRTALLIMLSNEQPFIPDYGSRLTLPKLPREPTGCTSPGAAGGTQRPRPCPRLCHFMLSYCVLCFAICVIRYPQTKTYKPRGRASDVSTISTCFSFSVMIYCPLPHQSLWERGVSLSCTCVAFSPFAKLNRFFPQKKIVAFRKVVTRGKVTGYKDGPHDIRMFT